MSKDILKEHLKDYLTDRGVNINKTGTCLVCGQGTKTPCAGYNSKNNTYHCFSCGINYDIFDFLADDMQLDIKSNFREIYLEGCKMFNINQDINVMNKQEIKISKKSLQSKINYSDYYDSCHSNIDKTDYLINRGLNPEVIAKFNLGYDTDSKCLIIPVSQDYYIKRSTQEKKFVNLKGVEVQLFNNNI